MDARARANGEFHAGVQKDKEAPKQPDKAMK